MIEQRVPPQVGDVYQQMTVMMTSHWVSQAVRAVADLSLADHLAAARLTAAEIAKREGSAPTTTFRLMRACVAIGPANGRRERPIRQRTPVADVAQGHARFAARSGTGDHAAVPVAAVE